MTATADQVHTRRVAWFHCFSGIAGDMALGSLLDAGADLGEVKTLLRRVPFSGWELETEQVLRGGISCTRALVSSPDDVVVRTHANIVELVKAANLPERVEQRALKVFGVLAEVEGALHRRPAGQVHFHEVGGHDAIVDVVGTAAALEVLGIDDVHSSAVATGTGVVRTSHGLLPNPAPAVVRLLEGIPTYGRDTTVELTTPTGAALLSALATSFGPLPSVDIVGTGFGAGTRELDDLPNCTQVVLGARQGVEDRGLGAGQPVIVLEANLDDVSGELLSYALNTLMDAGAHDAWITPIVMKKGRPAHTVHVLSDPARAPALKELLRQATGTFGVRAVVGERWPSSRQLEAVEVEGHPVRVKSSGNRVKAEFDDAVAVAARTGLSPLEVSSRAEQAWRERLGATDPPVDLRPPADHDELA
jgi:pyridinium-3,5-bisthiocarboxylic acid mononucleotide nickel chelatase